MENCMTDKVRFLSKIELLIIHIGRRNTMIDVNKPVTNPELVRAISEMGKSNSKEKQDQVINEVMKAYFIPPVIISPTLEPSINNNEAV
jgi:hypothetical protein